MREVSGQDLAIDMCERLVGEFDADGTPPPLVLTGHAASLAPY